jgi:hypothetical protein
MDHASQNLALLHESAMTASGDAGENTAMALGIELVQTIRPGSSKTG